MTNYLKLRIRYEHQYEYDRGNIYMYLEPTDRPQQPLTKQWRHIDDRMRQAIREAGVKASINRLIHNKSVRDWIADFKLRARQMGYA